MNEDEKLQHDVMEELKWEASINATEIGVIVKDGVVTLTGCVDSYAERCAAESAVRRVQGVKAVAEEIEVRLPAIYQRSDADIATAVVNAFEWNIAIPHDRIKIMVRDGWVILDGELDLCYQKAAADEALHHLLGVRGVTNRITIKSKTRPAELKTQIEKALKRNGRLVHHKITVATWGDKVALYGTVCSLAEQDEAERIAWSAPGVGDVENHLTIAHQT